MYQVYAPPKHLNHLIRYYWLLDLNKKEHHVKEYIFAYPYVNWVFTLGTPYTVKDKQKGILVIKDTRILGPRTNFAEYVHPEGNIAFGVTFQFGSTRPLFREDTNTLTNKIILQDDILPNYNWLTPFFEDVQLDVFMNAFSNQMEKNSSERDSKGQLLWRQFIALITQGANYATSSSQMAKALKITQRHLQRITMQFSGLSPKQVQSMMRCRLAIKHISKTGFTPDFFHYGFYDQNHFIKEVKKWSGHTPKALLSLLN
ncbi:AraC family transcriptional regulator [uncultured Polaribacter sp.]|uniref:helix-turn-helix domain-containing protein n=1 Tax=uncultured Polaribacter sp. TaxID=174711 RepID=UPI00260CC093|nr:AraC family transcriptional regulator [uncultured Polaribacter sp.]